MVSSHTCFTLGFIDEQSNLSELLTTIHFEQKK